MWGFAEPRRVTVSIAVGIASATMTACTQSPPPATYASGTVALSLDGKLVYVADADNNQVLVINPDAKSVVHRIGVGAEPTRLITAADGRVFVTNRQGRSVSVVDPNKGTETARIPVGTEPTGLTLTKDGHTLVVANTTNATVSLIDVRSLKVRATVATDADPSGVTTMQDGHVWITHLKTGNVTVIDPNAIDPTSNGIVTTFSLLAPNSLTSGNRLPGQPLAPVIAGGRAYLVHVQSSNDPVPTIPEQQIVNMPPPGGSSYASGGGGGLPIPIVAGAVATIDVSTSTPMLLQGVDGTAVPFNGGISPPAMGPGTPTPTSVSAPPVPANVRPALGVQTNESVPPFLLQVENQALSGPSAAVVEPGARNLYITHFNSNNVAIVMTNPNDGAPAGPTPVVGLGMNGSAPTPFPGIPTNGLSTGIRQLVGVGAGPNGIAIPASADRAFVYNSLDHTLSILKADQIHNEVVEAERLTVGTSPLTPEQDLGRRLFFSASDPRMTTDSSGGIACASCHPSGREDGRTWLFTEGPRNTPTLAGRHLATTAPYHWDGMLKDMHDFNTVIVNRMGGVGDGSSPDAQGSTTSPLTDMDFNALLAFIDSLAPPDNPNNPAADPAQIQRGLAVFTDPAVGCATCHVGPDHTDNSFHDVGTMVNNGATGQPEAMFFMDAPPLVGPNTPPLHNLFATAPYLHDGSAATLMDRVNDDRNGQHGHTSQLTPEQKADLVAFLNTL
jgi:YVTN family beta-propeller protein